MLEAQGAKEQSPLGSGGPRGAFQGAGACCPHCCALTLQLTASEEEFLRTYAGVVSSQLSQLPQHSIDQGESGARGPARSFPGHWAVVL